jgi:hypothetical protein
VERARVSSIPAFKFLRPGAVGPFSGHAWRTPRGGEPGPWLESPARGGACRDGVHACEARHLPLWIWEELWAVELDGEVERRRHKLRAPRGRLVRRVEAWSSATARSFARACAGRAALHAEAAAPAVARVAAGMAGDGDTRASAAEGSDDPYVAAHGAAVSAYISAMTAARVGGRELHDAEREWQAAWLVRELGLPGAGEAA